MGYNKLIIYGDTVESYEYEHEPIDIPKRRLGRRKKDDVGEEERLEKKRENAKRAQNSFRRLVASNLGEKEIPILVSLTYKENMSDIAQGYDNYRSFTQALRYKYGKDFRYICVPEFQKRGAVHFHSLFWGLPPELPENERNTRELAQIWGHGFVDILVTDGHEKLSSYLAKYMAKTFADPRLRNKKSYVASRNIQRPQVVKGIRAIDIIIEDHTGTDTPEFQNEYKTRWLGKCIHRIYRGQKEKL